MFRDKLVSDEHCSRFDSLLASAFRSKWSHSPPPPDSSFFTTLGQGKQSPGAAEGAASVRYLERLGPDEVLKACSQGLTFFEREEKDLGLLLFPQVTTRGRRRNLHRTRMQNDGIHFDK